VSDELDVLLIEDNPGDARLIEEMLLGAAHFLHRIDLDGSRPSRSEIHHEQDLAAGIEHLSDADIDVILLDLGLPDSTGLETLATVVDETEFTPIIVLTGLDDRDLGIRSIQIGAQDYLVKNEVTGELLIHAIQYAIERNQRERERVRHREQLEALNHLNRISQKITHDIITTSTRDELERAVCNHLVEADAYRLAWIGEVDRIDERISPRVAAGVEADSLDEIPFSLDSDSTDQSPLATSIRTGQIAVRRTGQTDSSPDPWRNTTGGRDDRSVAFVPIAYEDFLYGILTVSATSPDAFSEPEREILSRLGDIIGHAITAIERRDALVGDTVVELEFETADVIPDLVALTSGGECSITFESLIRGDDAIIVYGRTEGVAPEQFTDAVERTPTIDEVRLLQSEHDLMEFELVTTAVQSLTDAVSTHGGRIQGANVAGGEFRFTVEFPPGRDKRQLVELVESHCPNASNRAHRVVKRSERQIQDLQSAVQDRLTEKQQTALKAAYHAGLFDWPKQSTGEEVANRLGISPATFNQHLRAAERAFFESAFE